jgi:2'-5' RNA ligase
MLNYEKQIRRYEKIWANSLKTFGDTLWQDDYTILYWIGIHLNKDCFTNMQSISENLQNLVPQSSKNLWLSCEDMHITLMIPGRIGKQFQKDDIPVIEESLGNAIKNFPKFTVELGNLNYFPGAVFREIYDRENKIFELHNKIADSISFDLHPEYRYENFIPHMSIAYLATEHKDLVKHPKFKREIDCINMKVDKVFFSSITDGGHKYQEKRIREFVLS